MRAGYGDTLSLEKPDEILTLLDAAYWDNLRPDGFLGASFGRHLQAKFAHRPNELILDAREAVPALQLLSKLAVFNCAALGVPALSSRLMFNHLSRKDQDRFLASSTEAHGMMTGYVGHPTFQPDLAINCALSEAESTHYESGGECPPRFLFTAWRLLRPMRSFEITEAEQPRAQDMMAQLERR